MANEEKKYTPLLPFDGTYGQHFTTYENMAYECNRDLCHPNIVKSTGNIVKYYEYRMDDEKENSDEENKEDN